MTKILLVEDDKSLREIYGVRLLAEGYDIISAGDGEEALAMAIKDRPALIISDVMMPKISGFDMLDILRSTTETKTIKVIMMTALSSEDQRSRGEQLGADRYLVKSQVGIEDVVRTVHEVLADAPTSSNSPSTSAQPSQAPLAPSRIETPTIPPRPAAPQQQPVQPSAPEPPRPAPTAPAATSSSPQQTSSNSPDSSLPRPTAPFSTQRPAGLGLSDRVINPLPKQPETGPNVSERMQEELSDMPHLPNLGSSTPATNSNDTVRHETPPANPAPAPSIPSQSASPSSPPPAQQPQPNPFVATPTPPNPPNPFATDSAAPSAQSGQNVQSSESGIRFEETPRPSQNPFSSENRTA